jgi:predicted dehydrogenase
MGDTIKVGVIGVGQVGKRHVERYQQLSGAEIVAVADIDQDEATRVAQINKVPRAFTDFHNLLALDDIHAVDVCLHNNLHAPVSIAAMEAGKHVFCEKPIAGSYSDALAMVDTARRLGRNLGIQIQDLFSMPIKAAKRLIDEGYLGKIYYARSVGVRRRGRPYVDGYGTPSFVRKEIAGGGAIFDVGVYNIATMLYLMGTTDVKTISGRAYQEIDMYPDRRETSGYNVEEMGLGWVRLGHNITLDIEESWAIHYDDSESSKILGSRGGLRLDPLTYFTTIADLEMDGTFDLARADFRWHSCDEAFDAYDSPEAHWIAGLQGRVEMIDTAGLALTTSLISEGIYLSNQLDREVSAEEVRENSVSTALANSNY